MENLKEKVSRQEIIITSDTTVSIKIINSEIKTQYVIGVYLLDKIITDYINSLPSENKYEIP